MSMLAARLLYTVRHTEEIMHTGFRASLSTCKHTQSLSFITQLVLYAPAT